MSRVDNLGAYNQVRVELQKCGGDIAKYRKTIGAKAVVKSAPALIAIVLGLGFGAQAIVKHVRSKKKQKELLVAKESMELQAADNIVKELEEPEGSSGSQEDPSGESIIAVYELNMDKNNDIIGGNSDANVP